MTASEIRYVLAIGDMTSCGGVKLARVAEKLAVSKVSVYKKMDIFVDKGIAQWDENRNITLTAKGKTEYAKMKAATQYLTERLVKELGSDRRSAEIDAIEIMGNITKKNRDKIVRSANVNFLKLD